MARVLIAGGSGGERAKLRAELRQAGHVVCGEAVEEAAVVELALETNPDVCLFEVGRPADAIRDAGELTSKLPGTAVVVVGQLAHVRLAAA